MRHYSYLTQSIVFAAGLYAYMDSASVQMEGARTRLTSRQLSTFDMKCLIFWYHMYGPHVASLSVIMLHHDGTETVAWTRSGSQSGDWLRGVVPLTKVVGPFQVSCRLWLWKLDRVHGSIEARARLDF